MNRPHRQTRYNHPRAISTLEMIVTLTIAVLVITAVLAIYRNTVRSSEDMSQNAARQAATMACLDRMMDDVINASFAQPSVRVAGSGEGKTHLIIQTLPGSVDTVPTTQVEWAAVPGDLEDELVLYRREYIGDDAKNALYIPVCEHLMAFDAELFNPEGLDDPNAPPSMLDVQLTVFRDEPPSPDRVFTVFRTFCLRRR